MSTTTALSKNNKVHVSKTLAYLLRHSTGDIVIDSNGYADIPSVLNYHQIKKLSITYDMIKDIVDTNDKKRFEISPCGKKIRAAQGHSTGVISTNNTSLFTPITSVNDIKNGEAIHGTNYDVLNSIITNGLNRMKRDSIHFAQDGGVSGIRGGSQVLIYLDVEKCITDGIPLVLSSNGVILSTGENGTGVITSKYFKKIVNAKTRREINFRK